MKDEFKKLPEPIRLQIVFRLAMAGLFFFAFLVVWIHFSSIYLFIPCLLFGSFFLVNAAVLLYNGRKGNYVSVCGTCMQVETTTIRKRVKTIILKCDTASGQYLTIMVREKMKRIVAGDTVTVYLSEQEPVYDRDGGYLICNYYAIEIQRGVCP